MIINNPPYNLDAEQSLLGAFITDVNSQQCREAMDMLNEDMFYLHGHKTIFKTIKRLVNENQNVNLITVTEALEANHELENVGGFVYCAEITNSNISHNLSIVTS